MTRLQEVEQGRDGSAEDWGLLLRAEVEGGGLGPPQEHISPLVRCPKARDEGVKHCSIYTILAMDRNSIGEAEEVTGAMHVRHRPGAHAPGQSGRT